MEVVCAFILGSGVREVLLNMGAVQCFKNIDDGANQTGFLKTKLKNFGC